MSEVKEPKAKFERILLYKDEERIEKSMKDWQRTANKLNESLSVAMAFVGIELKDDGKEDLLKGGYKRAIELMRPNFPFPNAEIDFNLKAMGKDPEPLRVAMRSTPGWFDQIFLAVENGNVVLTEKGKAEIDERCCIYTKHDKQNEVYHKALILCQELNKAVKFGFIQDLDKYPLERLINVAKWDNPSKGYIPAPKYISRIDHQGVVRDS